MRIYEIFRKTKETYICFQINIDGLGLGILNFEIMFLEHMIRQLILQSKFNINIISIGDLEVDNHHLIEDIGICFGKVFNKSVLNRNILKRYGYSYVCMDDSLTRVVIDISGRSYLKYEVDCYNIYINNLDLDLFYDFFLSFVDNSKINLHISNLYGFKPHHKIESIFKSFGISLKKSVKFKKNKLIPSSTKGILF